jgi:hypothetical protein
MSRPWPPQYSLQHGHSVLGLLSRTLIPRICSHSGALLLVVTGFALSLLQRLRCWLLLLVFGGGGGWGYTQPHQREALDPIACDRSVCFSGLAWLARNSHFHSPFSCISCSPVLLLPYIDYPEVRALLPGGTGFTTRRYGKPLPGGTVLRAGFAQSSGGKPLRTIHL